MADFPAFAEKVQYVQQVEVREVVIYSEKEQYSLSRRQCCKTQISGETPLKYFNVL